ncbi:MAG: hemerythrin domain-containing protein [Deltaproteobacteria bacterium]|nr:hemerythrin domain-containing protein [Deltaproteobacteria bacterium]
MPIRRHDALRPLSRDHHFALQLARGVQSTTSPTLRAQLPKEPRALADHVIRAFRDELEPHFVAEDEVLTAAILGKDAELDGVWREIEREHVEVRDLVAQLGDRSLEDARVEALLDRLGRLLEAHVRKEERSLFERIQEVLDEPTLARLGAELERRHPPRATAL